MSYLCQQNVRIVSEVIVILDFPGDEHVCTVAYGKRHQECSGSSTQCHGLYFTKTQEKLKEKAGVVVRGNKNW